MRLCVVILASPPLSPVDVDNWSPLWGSLTGWKTTCTIPWTHANLHLCPSLPRQYTLNAYAYYLRTSNDVCTTLAHQTMHAQVASRPRFLYSKYSHPDMHSASQMSRYSVPPSSGAKLCRVCGPGGMYTSSEPSLTLCPPPVSRTGQGSFGGQANVSSSSRRLESTILPPYNTCTRHGTTDTQSFTDSAMAMENSAISSRFSYRSFADDGALNGVGGAEWEPRRPPSGCSMENSETGSRSCSADWKTCSWVGERNVSGIYEGKAYCTMYCNSWRSCMFP